MICYTYDQWGNYTGEHVHVKYQPLPARYTTEKPPAGDYPVWRGKWELWDEPAAPPPPPEPEPPTKEEQQANRQAAYTQEADPLFFKYQRGEATEQEWLDKIEEIRARYPYPEEAEE